MMGDSKAKKWPKIVLVLAAIYLLIPFDFISDLIPFLGWLDDLVVLVATITTVGKSVKAYKDKPSV